MRPSQESAPKREKDELENRLIRLNIEKPSLDGFFIALLKDINLK